MVRMNIQQIQAASVAMLGNKYRLEVAAAVGRSEGKPISSKGIEEDTGLPYNAVQSQVAWFREHGLLVDDDDPEKRRKEFRAVSTPYWAACVAVLNDLQERTELD
jgi:hypothetical protein